MDGEAIQEVVVVAVAGSVAGKQYRAEMNVQDMEDVAAYEDAGRCSRVGGVEVEGQEA